MKELEEYIHLSKYSKFIDNLNRRETWEETIDRYIYFWTKRYSKNIGINFDEIRSAILNKEVMPSMRALMTAGKALERCNTVGYNCAAVAVNNPRVFDEHFYLLMGGSGNGFSVERQYINKMPPVADEMHDTDTIIVVRDSRTGWAKALKELIALLYNGDVPKFDVSKVRKKGKRLKTMGGMASGPKPLLSLFEYTIRLFKNAKGRKLNSAECHKLMCKIAETVVVGSVRRSACISLGNLTDDRHRRLKTGEFWLQNPELFLSNNSVMYTEKPDIEAFTKEFRSLYKSRAGERGIVNQEALRKKAELCEREYSGQYLLNPCAETILRDSGQMCNLSEVIVRPDDTLEHLKSKVRIATIVGTLQSTLTNFKYLRKIWKDNAEEERLLGVSLTGIMDHNILSDPEKAEHYLLEMKKIAKKTNKEYSKILKIEESKQLTLVKPSGTVSLLASTASGIHPRHAKYYIRRVTQDKKDPLTTLMISEGIPHVDVGEKVIFSFPVKSPKKSKINVTTKYQLELWLVYRKYWCDGNPSQTIYYNEDTFLELQDWIWKNWDKIGGLSFFPKDDNIYENQPFETITKEEYDDLRGGFPIVNWGNLKSFEEEDCSTLQVAVGCAGGSCDL